MCLLIPDKPWIDALSALLTPVIAIAGIAIGVLQWRLSESQFRYQLFDRRYAVFEATKNYIGTIVQNGFPPTDAKSRFLQGTAGSLFIFDQTVSGYIDQIWKKSTTLESLHLALATENKEPETPHKRAQKLELNTWFNDELIKIESKFFTYLSVK